MARDVRGVDIDNRLLLRQLLLICCHRHASVMPARAR